MLEEISAKYNVDAPGDAPSGAKEDLLHHEIKVYTEQLEVAEKRLLAYERELDKQPQWRKKVENPLWKATHPKVTALYVNYTYKKVTIEEMRKKLYASKAGTPVCRCANKDCS